MKKNGLILLMTLCVIVSLLPIGASAADIVRSGTCGDNVTWTLDSDGLLTISGTGKMRDYDWESPFPSNYYLRSVEIKSGVTSIGDHAFNECFYLESVVIPKSVKSIGNYAFNECESLRNVTIPNSVAEIGYCAFLGCSSLQSIVIPDSVANIGWQAFSGCASLSDVVLPDSLSHIEWGVFQDCVSLTQVEIPDGVQYISSNTFEGCTNLMDVTIPESVTWISDAAFKDCVSLKMIRNLDDVTVGKNCFQGCSQLKSIVVGSVFEESVFLDCTSLEQFITYNTRELDAYVFGGCPSLKEVYLSKTLETVNANAFRDAAALTDVYYEGTPGDWNKIQIRATGNEPLLNARIHFNWNVISFSPFDDVMEWDNDYYFKPVLWALRHQPQITNGTSPTTFSPDATCTRGQVVTFLWRAKGCPEPKSAKNPFTDVPSSQYYYKAVLWANEQGITNGTSATTFSPDAPCTRAHVVTFLWRAESKPAAGRQNPFTDVPAGQYFTDAVLWAVSKTITNGTSPTTFSPDSPCTRGQIVTFLYRDMK